MTEALKVCRLPEPYQPPTLTLQCNTNTNTNTINLHPPSLEQKSPQHSPRPPDGWHHSIWRRGLVRGTPLDPPSTTHTHPDCQWTNGRLQHRRVSRRRSVGLHDFPWGRSCLLYSHCQGPRTRLLRTGLWHRPEGMVVSIRLSHLDSSHWRGWIRLFEGAIL
jgi:hypothetical protein